MITDYRLKITYYRLKIDDWWLMIFHMLLLSEQGRIFIFLTMMSDLFMILMGAEFVLAETNCIEHLARPGDFWT